MSILENHTSYFDMSDRLFDGINIRAVDMDHSDSGLQVVDQLRRVYRKEMVDLIMTMPYGIPKGLEDYEMGLLELRALMAAAFNTSLIKIMREDMDTFVVYLNRRSAFVDPMKDITLGDVMLILAERLDIRYGGSIKFWLGFMFYRTGCADVEVDYRDIMSELVNYRHYSDYGYGLFGDEKKRITHKNHGFNEQYFRFVNDFMV